MEIFTRYTFSTLFLMKEILLYMKQNTQTKLEIFNGQVMSHDKFYRKTEP